MLYIKPGSTSQSLVVYLQDAVTGGAYTTEDQADWTFRFARDGSDGTDYTNNTDATITAGTLGTWAAGTAKPFEDDGLWQIDFADAAFAAGVGYVSLLITHDNGDFIPCSILVDLSVRQSDVIQMGGVVQSATDLKDFADEGYNPATNKVQGVVLVDTTTENSDMRGTDSAATEAKQNIIDTNVDAILSDTETDGVVVATASKTGYKLAIDGWDTVEADGVVGSLLISAAIAVLLGKTDSAGSPVIYKNRNGATLVTVGYNSDGVRSSSDIEGE